MVKIVYCDHSHNFLKVQDINNKVVGEDIRLNNIGTLKLTKDNYAGNDKYITDALNRNSSIRLNRYDCPYCRTLGKEDISFMFNPELGNKFIRLRKNNQTNTWDIDDTARIGTEDMFGDSAYVLTYE